MADFTYGHQVFSSHCQVLFLYLQIDIFNVIILNKKIFQNSMFWSVLVSWFMGYYSWFVWSTGRLEILKDRLETRESCVSAISRTLWEFFVSQLPKFSPLCMVITTIAGLNCNSLGWSRQTNQSFLAKYTVGACQYILPRTDWSVS